MQFSDKSFVADHCRYEKCCDCCDCKEREGQTKIITPKHSIDEINELLEKSHIDSDNIFFTGIGGYRKDKFHVYDVSRMHKFIVEPKSVNFRLFLDNKQNIQLRSILYLGKWKEFKCRKIVFFDNWWVCMYPKSYISLAVTENGYTLPWCFSSMKEFNNSAFPMNNGTDAKSFAKEWLDIRRLQESYVVILLTEEIKDSVTVMIRSKNIVLVDETYGEPQAALAILP